MNASAQNERRLLEARIATLEQTIRRIPSRFAGGGTSQSSLYQVIGGNTLTYLGKGGIKRRSDAVLGSELPAGAGGTGIVSIPAYPVPVGLPDGVGVAVSLDGISYIFVLNDVTSGNTAPDLVMTDDVIVVQATTVNLDKVVSSVTYRYTCYRPTGGKF